MKSCILKTLFLSLFFISHFLVWGQVTVTAGLVGHSRHSSPQVHLGDPEAFPGQMGCIFPPASSESVLGSPASWMCPQQLQRKPPRSHSDQMPEQPQLAPFRHEGAVSLLQAPSKPLTLSLRLSPDTLQRKLILVACIRSLILLVITQSSRP